MKLYDFSAYAIRKKEQLASQAVAEAVVDLNSPGSVIVLKDKINTYLALHREVLKYTYNK